MMIVNLIPTWQPVPPAGPAGRAGRGGIAALTLGVLAAVVTACGSEGTGSGPAGGGRHLAVVAAENFWGSIASQLGGDAVTVLSVVSDPNADPHEYETNGDDAKAVANADYVIVNGAGYDSWADKLVSGNPSNGRTVTTIADLLGGGRGDNPHFWYSPGNVEKVADRITADLTALDPQDGTYFAAQRRTFETALGPYRARIADIRARFSGRPVGSTESIVVDLASALGLDLISPPDFMRAVSEGNDPPAASVAEFQTQVQQRQIRVLVYNAQTVTNVTSNLRNLAATRGIPTVAVTETMQPSGTTFQDWQVSQLTALATALAADAPSG